MIKHTQIQLSPPYRDNLYKHAVRLPRVVKEVATMFTMSVYSMAEDQQAVHDCGTVGCSLGFATHTVCRKRKHEFFADYGKRVFGVHLNADVVTQDLSDLWEWFFSDQWAYVDNTPEGASRRILYFLENGLPYNWAAQMMNKRTPRPYNAIAIPAEDVP